jgi:DNA-binding transcriptional ArsR family regulator
VRRTFCDDHVVVDLDERLNGVVLEEHRTSRPFEVGVDWAPAYELVVSLGTFIYASLGGQSLLENGPVWAAEVRQVLPHDLVQRLSRKSVAKAFKHHEVDRLTLLVQAAPGSRTAPEFIDWFARLTAGAAYEALAPSAAEPGPRLPRDFAEWRDSLTDLLGLWHAGYFARVNPAILSGLSRAADNLRARLPATQPIDLVEEVTNGLVLEPSATLQHVVLVPQYHHRPYNDTTEFRNGGIIQFPFDVTRVEPGVPSPRLLRLTHALSDDSRLRILRFLAGGPCSLTEVARHAALSQPTVHHHLTQLRAAGLVRVHCAAVCGPSRYSLRPHALEQLSEQLGAYLLPDWENAIR